ncbi:DUF3996 domain-containing protein [Borrelia sp. HM]|uniref:DUF3996 domain-containing protein n=1 Tax=Borrelia sp. HM TaxID=1882662 RepID=UPI001C76620A|nr:DUF3996 domain-containing protein [Borrelia sp. HM]BCR21834.1 hypothetical protein BKFM_00402 [Borrelia sp. HM]
MRKKYQKIFIFILILMFNSYYFAFSKSNHPYSIECKQEDDGTVCITNTRPTPEKPNPTPKQPNPTPKQRNPIPEKPNPIPKQTNPYLAQSIVKAKNNPYSFAAGIGIGNPFINILISIPYIDINLGYGGFLYLNPENFHPFNLIGIDLSFKQQIGTLILGGGFGVGADWSQANLTIPGGTTTQTSPYERIAILARLPISIEHKIIKNLSLGLKVCATVGPTIFLTKPKIVFEGMRFKFFAIGFIRFFM